MQYVSKNRIKVVNAWKSELEAPQKKTDRECGRIELRPWGLWLLWKVEVCLFILRSTFLL